MFVGGLPSILSMKIPSILDRFLPQKQPEKELFSSLVLDEEYAAASLWEMGDKGVPRVLAADSKPCAENSWEARIDAVDEALATVEDIVGTTKYSKVVLGLPPEYLTPEGDVRLDVRPHIKMLTRELELKAIGFVSLPQAILYRIKKEEGVPPSVILLDVTKKTITISLYRVGVLTGEYVRERATDTAITLEEALKEFKNLEVLPARILLYGHDGKDLEDVKTELLRYPWTTRVNFLHFPKIEILPPKEVAEAVSLAGASELAHQVDNEEEQAPPEEYKEPEKTAEAVAEAEAIAEAEEGEEDEDIREEEEESNVVAVDPANLGFRKNVDVLEKPETPQKKPMKLPAISMPALPSIDLSGIFKGGAVPFIIIAGVLILIAGLLYWFVPHATVTVLMLPKSLSASETITIDPAVTSVVADSKVIPGTGLQKSVSGSKTIAVTGKKDVGTPAKGGVTIYNKTTDAKTFSKGAVLTVGSLQFTLDTDVQVASASEEVGSLTFGKGSGSVTASAIGTDSNLAAGKEFDFKGIDPDIAVARNDSALAGGTSKSVTVVSRADQDAFVKAVSSDLVDKAKQDLAGSVTGSQKLIDATIATSVTKKKFNQEIDQEATQLSGDVTLTVSGVSYNEDDVKTLMKSMITGQIPAGYALSEGRTTVTLENVKVAKDGKITAKATIKTDAIPTLDASDIRSHISGKTLSSAQEYLKGLTGVAGVVVRFGLGFGKNRLPINSHNITVTLSIQ